MLGRTNYVRDSRFGDLRPGSSGEPPLAAHLVTSRVLYTHHGIYVGNGCVIHYAGLADGLRRGPVEQVSLERFARGRSIRIQPDRRRFDRCEVVERALSRLGEAHYRFLTNNCEHFCSWALRGECLSEQVERLRAVPRLLSSAAALLHQRLVSAFASAYTLVQSKRDATSVDISCVTRPRTKESVMHASLRTLVALSVSVALAATIAFAADSAARPAHDKYALKVPGGLAFAEFRGFESWQAVSVSHNEKATAVILANPAMIAAYQAGIPGNGKPVPDGAKMAKIHWNPKKHQYFPDNTVPGTQRDVDFMVKDSKRFADSGGWGYAVFRYDAATDTFYPGTLAEQPPQANDARCGVACHTVVKSRDFVFTEYAHR